MILQIVYFADGPSLNLPSPWYGQPRDAPFFFGNTHSASVSFAQSPCAPSFFISHLLLQMADQLFFHFLC